MPWQCPKCERMLTNANSVHCCVKREFDEVFAKKDAVLIYLFEKILAEVYDWEGVHISATEKCIVFLSNQTFLVIKPMSKQLDVKFYLETENTSYPIVKVEKYGKHFAHHIRISDFEAVNRQLFTYLRRSYELFVPE